ncbi:MAG TPA: methyltransferase domain-containing protein [Vicinamibacteria bacterium]|nr:methyltransferase domain-containing protein [Vicinamibacteria bacterium]
MTSSIGARPIERLSAPAEVGFPGDWYELNSAQHFWFQWRIEAALRQWRDARLPLDAPLRLLDVGGGRGVLRDQVEASTSWTVDLVELNQEALQQAEPGRGRHLYYDVRDKSSTLVGTYDGAILFDVIEHLEETRPVLEAVRDHLRPGGLLILNVPALQALFSAYDVAAGHFRRYDLTTLAAELPAADWEIVDARYWGLTLVPLLAVRKVLLRSPDAETIRRGFGPPSGFVHACLRALMRVETAAVRRPPVGSSLLLVARRRSSG